MQAYVRKCESAHGFGIEQLLTKISRRQQVFGTALYHISTTARSIAHCVSCVFPSAGGSTPWAATTERASLSRTPQTLLSIRSCTTGDILTEREPQGVLYLTSNTGWRAQAERIQANTRAVQPFQSPGLRVIPLGVWR